MKAKPSKPITGATKIRQTKDGRWNAVTKFYMNEYDEMVVLEQDDITDQVRDLMREARKGPGSLSPDKKVSLGTGGGNIEVVTA